MTPEKPRDAAWSVVITAHNAAADLEETLDAVAAAAEHAGGGEVIVVDDRSTDGQLPSPPRPRSPVCG